MRYSATQWKEMERSQIAMSTMEPHIMSFRNWCVSNRHGHTGEGLLLRYFIPSHRIAGTGLEDTIAVAE